MHSLSPLRDVRAGGGGWPIVRPHPQDAPAVPFIAKIFADGGYVSRKLNADLSAQPVTLEIVKRTDKDGGFKVVRRRRVVERTFSWLRRNWPAAGLADTKIGCFMKPEVRDATQEIWS